MRVTSAFSRLLALPGVWVRSVGFEPDRVVVTVALCRRRLQCPKCSYCTRHRENKQRHDSVWRHLDLGVWRLEVHARLRRLRCPEHGVHVEGVPFAGDGARFTRDFENLIAWLATGRSRSCRSWLSRIDWQTIGRIIERVGDELIDGDRLSELFEISIDEVAWRKGHRYLTLVGDHRRRCVVWGCEGKGQAAADEFFAELDPVDHEAAQSRNSEPSQTEAEQPADTVRAIFAAGLTIDAVAELIDRLLARLSRSRLKPFVRLGRTIRKHRDGSLAARRHKLSNARAEAMNNKAQLIVRRAYGFHSASAALALIHLTCGPVTLTLPRTAARVT